MMKLAPDDIKRVNATPFIPWDQLKGSTIYITGATGLIGKTLVKSLLYANAQRHLNLHMILLVRDYVGAMGAFQDIDDKNSLSFIVGNVEDLHEIPGSVDYIIHCASQTASKEFVNHAVETIHTTVYGTDNTLTLARNKNVKSLVFLSSMEVYGYPSKGHRVAENEIGQFTPYNIRNSYSISKVMGEMLCISYWKEYGVPAKIIRLTQTIGNEVKQEDQRFPAYLERCVLKKENIILKTKGETERSYLLVQDAVTAILTVLLKGRNGSIYNAADEDTYCSISEMAEKIAKENGINVIYDINDNPNDTYLDTLYMNLDTSALRSLGWKPLT